MASKVILKLQDTIIGEYVISQEETVIGRKPESTIPIVNPSISSRHARIIRIGSKDILEDLGSTNGTFINGKKVAKYVLKHGDNIAVGNHTLIYVDLDAAPLDEKQHGEEEGGMDKTMILTPEARAAMMAQHPTAGGAAASDLAKGHGLPLAGVQILTGFMAGKSVDLVASLTSIGKDDNCKIKVKGFTVGKQAAAITRRPAGYHISHIGGMTRLKINGETLGDQPYTLKEGDIIELGDTKMEFYFKEPEE